jgi:hypothetical protein
MKVFENYTSDKWLIYSICKEPPKLSIKTIKEGRERNLHRHFSKEDM